MISGDPSLTFNEGDSGSFNVCVAVADLPSGGLSCDQVITIETESDTAG